MTATRMQGGVGGGKVRGEAMSRTVGEEEEEKTVKAAGGGVVLSMGRSW